MTRGIIPKSISLDLCPFSLDLLTDDAVLLFFVAFVQIDQNINSCNDFHINRDKIRT
jgi:hypothetical protein